MSTSIVVWGDEVGLAEAVRVVSPALVILSTPIEIVPAAGRARGGPSDEATLPHGPPRVSLSLRAPPSASLLI